MKRHQEEIKGWATRPGFLGRAVISFTAMPRKPFPKAVLQAVVVRCKRRCAFCFGIEQDVDEKEGQVAHIDAPENNALDNAAWLCHRHHALYDSTSHQAKGYLPGELKAHQHALYAYVEHLETKVYKKKSGSSPGRRTGRKAGVSLEVYDRRVPIYQATMQFVRDVLTDLRPDLRVIFKFAAVTDEALFLFDENIAEYLANLYKQATRLRAVEFTLDRRPTDNSEVERFEALVQEDANLAIWFSEQHDEIRARFAPFLRLA